MANETPERAFFNQCLNGWRQQGHIGKWMICAEGFGVGPFDSYREAEIAARETFPGASFVCIDQVTDRRKSA